MRGEGKKDRKKFRPKYGLKRDVTNSAVVIVGHTPQARVSGMQKKFGKKVDMHVEGATWVKGNIHHGIAVALGNTKPSVVVLGASKMVAKIVGTADVYLGGKENLTVKTPLDTEEDYIHLIRKGIRKKSLDHLVEATAISVSDMAAIMQTTSKELAALKPNELLEKDQSEKVVNIARLYAMGEEAFGSAAEFNKWMNGRVPSLGKKRPKDFLDTSSGINLLMDEISRIQYGVYS